MVNMQINKIPKSISSELSSNYDADASELLESCEKIFLR